LSESEAARYTSQNTRNRTTIISKGLVHALNYAEATSVGVPGTVLTSKSQMVSSDGESSSGIHILDRDCGNCGIEISKTGEVKLSGEFLFQADLAICIRYHLLF